MENIKEPMDKKKLLPIILGGLALIIIIVIIVLASSKKGEVKPEDKIQTSGLPGEAGMDLEEPGEIEPGMDNDMEAGGEVVEVNPVLVDAVAAIQGANLISKEGKVITNEGLDVKTDVSAMDAQAPRQSLGIDKDSVPESSIKLDISNAGYVPSEFTVKKGEAVNLVLTSTDQWSHGIKFDDPKLRAVAIGISGGETGGITFNAPNEPGEYTFQCTVIGHGGIGETGKMIVK